MQTVPTSTSTLERFAQLETRYTLVIARDYEVYLQKRGERIHIPMTPLVKTLYFFYLRHPEGISRYQLPDYQEELSQLYAFCKYLRVPKSHSGRLELLWDRWDNSFNEKCAHIKSRFKKHLPPQEAQQFYIFGEKRQAKSISLAQNEIIWEKQLPF